MPFRRMGAGAAVALATIFTAGLGQAATPDRGALRPGVTVEWAGGPLTGSAPVQRNTVCTQANCDDFTLDIQVPDTTFAAPKKAMVVITLTTTAPNDIRMIVSAPGADIATGSTDYTAYGKTAQIISPKAGVWRIRAACYACASASYTAKAEVKAFDPPPLEALGSFSWFGSTLPGGGEGEPGIAVDKDNRLFVNAPATNSTGAGFVWRSADKGHHWTLNAGVDTMPPGNSGDSDLAVAPDDGTVYFMNLSDDAFTNWVYASADHGSTYTGPGWAGSDSDRQWFATAPNGVVWVAYHDLALPAQQMYVLRSDDHGKNFTKISDVNLGADSYKDSICGNHMSRPVVDPKDPQTLYFMYSVSPVTECETADPTAPDHYFTDNWIAKSTDGGSTWTQTKIYESDHTTDHNLTSMAIDSAGNLYVCISESGPGETFKNDQLNEAIETTRETTEGAGETAAASGEGNLATHIKILTSTDHGATWSKPVQVDQLRDHHSNVFGTVVAGDTGRVGVAWYTSRASDFDAEDATWTVAYAFSNDATSKTPHFAQSRVSQDVAHTGAICQSGLNCTVTGANRNLLDFMDIDVGPDGLAAVVWADDTSGKTLVKVAAQTSGTLLRSRVLAKVIRKPAVKPAQKRGGRLPATGVGSELGGLLLAAGLALGVRLRMRAR